MAIERARGGFVKPIQLSLYIRDQLAAGAEFWGNELYSMYKEAIQKAYRAIDEARPPKRRKGKRKIISYAGFRIYLYVLRRLGLIEYILEDGEIKGDVPLLKDGITDAPFLSKTHYFRAVISRINDPAWQNIWQAYKGIR